MRALAALYAELDASTSIRVKSAALQRYFRSVPAADAAWGLYFLAGGRPRRLLPAAVLRGAALAVSGLPAWLFEECYHSVGDLAETIALLLDEPQAGDPGALADWMSDELLPLRGLAPAEQAERVAALWRRLDAPGRFVLNKLITGGFRVGVSRQLVLRALAAAFGREEHALAQRVIGYTAADARPDARAFHDLIGEASADGAAHPPSAAQPYPFFLAQPFQQDPISLGSVADWLVEWKWDGIRAQLVCRHRTVSLWSRGEELITDRFPEIRAAAEPLSGPLVFDGELLCWLPEASAPMPFAVLQTRIGRRTLSARRLREAPARFVAYDLLEDGSGDLRALPLHERRERLQAVSAKWGAGALGLSERLESPDWPSLQALRAESRARGVEGLMLKRATSAYGVGRTRSHPRGDWWKWKIDPWSVDAVLVYAQAGHGRRASLYTDYTFAVWDGPPGSDRRLVPFAKAYSGLSDDEIRTFDGVIRRTTIEKFGPVRSVTPSLVFEIGFEGIARSPRHKSGVAVRFARILRPRPDKRIDDADQLATLLALIDGPPAAPG
ncbi:MAG: ATP-dependent DNA ligase [Burkholderiaceae bacterium]|nr:ATP-dependent DNA ligase [Burkholderiaceae bacterium]